jgi:ribulose bisphosphate carboxylase small subunit
MIRYYAFTALALAAFILGWQAREWKGNSDEKKQIEKTIEVHNEAVEKINEVVREVEVIKVEYRDKIIRLPAVDSAADCPIGDITRLRNQAVQSLDQKLFHGTD